MLAPLRTSYGRQGEGVEDQGSSRATAPPNTGGVPLVQSYAFFQLTPRKDRNCVPSKVGWKSGDAVLPRNVFDNSAALRDAQRARNMAKWRRGCAG